MELLKEKKLLSNKAIFWLMGLAVFLLPLFFWPWSRQPILGGKLVLLMVVDLLGLAIWGLGFLEGKRKIFFPRKLTALLLLIIWGFISWFLAGSGVRVRSLLEINPWWVIALSVIFVFLLGQTDWRRQPQKVMAVLSAAGVLLALTAIALFILPPKFYPLRPLGPYHPFVIGDSLWSPLGSALATLIFLAALFLFWLQKLVAVGRKNEHRLWQKANFLVLVLAFVFLVGGGVESYQLYQHRPQLLGFKTSWVIAVESLKNKPLWGVGPANFVNAFAAYRPLQFNQSKKWNLLFSQPANFWFHIWTEIGILGLVLWVWFLVVLWRVWRKKKDDPLSWILLFLAVAEFILPVGAVTIWLFLLLASLFVSGQEIVADLPEWARRSIATVMVLIVAGLSFFLGHALIAEYWFVRSLVAINHNNGMAAYRCQQRAVRNNRFVLPYRLGRSQTDLALVAALARRGKNLKAKDKQALTALVQEAIVEAKAGVALEPHSFLAWRNLAQTYQQLINLAKGADQWAIAAHQQAISLNPLDPRLRLSLGGIYYSLGQYEQAGQVFQAAVNLKPDWANGWYNWAWSLKRQKKLAAAVQRLKQAITLVDINSPDYQKAKGELDQWQKLLGKKTKQTTPAAKPKELSLPTPVPSPVVTPIQLSKEAAPQITVSPTP